MRLIAINRCPSLACTEQHLSGDSYSISISYSNTINGATKWKKNEFNWDVCSLVNCISFFFLFFLKNTCLDQLSSIHILSLSSIFHVISPKKSMKTSWTKTSASYWWIRNVYDWALCSCSQQPTDVCDWLLPKHVVNITPVMMTIHRSIWKQHLSAATELHFWYFVIDLVPKYQ